MEIVQSTWVRYHHFDLARELHKKGFLKKIFTCLPPWKVKKEAFEQGINRNLISSNFFFEGIRRMGQKMPFYNKNLDGKLAVLQTKTFSKWVAHNLPECDTYIGISGSGLQAGRLAKKRGSGYIMDRGSTQIRYADNVLYEEYKKWNLKWNRVNEWLIENEEAEAAEADIITVPSDFVKKTFVDSGIGPAKIRVVPYGVSLQEFYPSGVPLATNSFKILFVGNFSIRKGAPYLLKAFNEFKHPKKELVIVGNVQTEVKKLVNKYSNSNIKFLGIVPRDQVRNYMIEAHVLVLPSIEEGLALVQAQAMACGCPVIATPNTGSETLFQHEKEGLIIQARNVQAIVKAFEYIADSSEHRAVMSEACITRVKSFGGWQTYTEKIIEIAKAGAKI